MFIVLVRNMERIRKRVFFNNVTSGIHAVFVMDINGCSEMLKEGVILVIPNFFTSNDDSYINY